MLCGVCHTADNMQFYNSNPSYAAVVLFSSNNKQEIYNRLQNTAANNAIDSASALCDACNKNTFSVESSPSITCTLTSAAVLMQEMQQLCDQT